MIVYRVEREKYLKSTLLGIGASLTKGFRWNSLNTRLVYTSESRALATLEVFVHLDIIEDLPSDRYIVEIDIPDSIKFIEVDIKELPINWDAKPPEMYTQNIGDDFDNQVLFAVIKVPSSIIPNEFNYLINPEHPDSKKIKIIKKTKFSFDTRIKK